MYRGYIKLWRKTKDSFIWRDSKAVHLWVYLLFSANYEDKEFMFNGEKHVCNRGQIVTGRKKLAGALQINEYKVYRLLKLLENAQLITQRRTNRYSLITIVNYNLYQGNGQLVEQQMHNSCTTDAQQMHTTKEGKELKELKKNIYEHFESLWIKYPKRMGKKEAFIHYKASVKTDKDRERIEGALENFLNSKHGGNRDKVEFIPMGKTWFNNWEDWSDGDPVESKAGSYKFGKELDS